MLRLISVNNSYSSPDLLSSERYSSGASSDLRSVVVKGFPLNYQLYKPVCLGGNAPEGTQPGFTGNRSIIDPFWLEDNFKIIESNQEGAWYPLQGKCRKWWKQLRLHPSAQTALVLLGSLLGNQHNDLIQIKMHLLKSISPFGKTTESVSLTVFRLLLFSCMLLTLFKPPTYWLGGKNPHVVDCTCSFLGIYIYLRYLFTISCSLLPEWVDSSLGNFSVLHSVKLQWWHTKARLPFLSLSFRPEVVYCDFSCLTCSRVVLPYLSGMLRCWGYWWFWDV